MPTSHFFVANSPCRVHRTGFGHQNHRGGRVFVSRSAYFERDLSKGSFFRLAFPCFSGVCVFPCIWVPFSGWFKGRKNEQPAVWETPYFEKDVYMSGVYHSRWNTEGPCLHVDSPVFSPLSRETTFTCLKLRIPERMGET